MGLMIGDGTAIWSRAMGLRWSRAMETAMGHLVLIYFDVEVR